MTHYETWLDGRRERFATLAEAERYMESEGLEYYYLPVGEIEKYPHSNAAFQDLYGDGYEPSITPVEDEDDDD